MHILEVPNISLDTAAGPLKMRPITLITHEPPKYDQQVLFPISPYIKPSFTSILLTIVNIWLNIYDTVRF